MSEKDLDSSKNPYLKKNESKNNIKQVNWDMAIGLQEVDNLKPSKYLEQIREKNVLGELTIEEVEQSLKAYYVEKEKQNNINHNELECDFVSMRIIELLEQDNFELSVDYLKYIHKYLFQDVYEFAGKFRNINFSKQEEILNNDSVAYGDYKTLTESLEYDINLEKNKDYKSMSILDVINNIVNFSSIRKSYNSFKNQSLFDIVGSGFINFSFISSGIIVPLCGIFIIIGYSISCSLYRLYICIF